MAQTHRPLAEIHQERHAASVKVLELSTHIDQKMKEFNEVLGDFRCLDNEYRLALESQHDSADNPNLQA